jgi:cytochrome c-type biogenesis protein CcmH
MALHHPQRVARHVLACHEPGRVLAAAARRTLFLHPANAQTLADFADTVAMAQGRRLQGEPERIVRRALEVDGRNLKALALAGTILFEKGDYRGAIGEWQKVRALVPDDSNVARGMENSIRDAENRLAAGGGAPRTVAAAQGSGVAVKGRVSLDPALKTKVSPQDTVFIFARAEQGPKMPVAMIKRTVADLPLDFTLDDSQAMSPNLRLSQQTRVVVGARVSRSGDALPRPGDWQAFSGAIAPGTGDVKLVIDMPVQ